MSELSADEAMAFFARLFPDGLCAPDLLAELCPDGWSASPLRVCFHPTMEQRYAEEVAFTERMRELHLRNPRSGADPPTLISFEQFAREEAEDLPAAARPPVTDAEELAELLGMCLWDVFSDNHHVIAADGRIVSLGSFRGSGGFIADFFERGPGPQPSDDSDDDPWGAYDNTDYLRFYLGTVMRAHRADLTPVYAEIFRRIRLLGADWQYAFPRIHVIDFGDQPQDDEPTGYDPSAVLQQEEANRKRREETVRIQADLDRETGRAKKSARSAEPPATVLAYQRVYGQFPVGWPPDPYSID